MPRGPGPVGGCRMVSRINDAVMPHKPLAVCGTGHTRPPACRVSARFVFSIGLSMIALQQAGGGSWSFQGMR
jgi:hypothetical protein